MKGPRRQLPVMFHGTVRSGWNPLEWDPEDWFHAGDLSSATWRLKGVGQEGGFEGDEYEGPKSPAVYRISLLPDVRVGNKVAAVRDRETGMYRDLGDRMRDGDAPWIEERTSKYDVIPYENVGEGGTSYFVRAGAVKGVHPFKRYSHHEKGH